MKAKERAEELFGKFYDITPYTVDIEDSEEFASENIMQDISLAKRCAIICVDELISAFKQLSIEDSGSVLTDFGHGYWMEVKQEIEKL